MVGLIVAMTKNRVIGNQGIIPWRIKGEQKRFRELTTGNTVIMGRRSYEEIGKPLPNRDTIVISNTCRYEREHLKTASSLKEAITMVNNGDIFISGGGKLYQESLELVDKIYLTIIDMEVQGDTYFPEFCEEDFNITETEIFKGEIPYTYYTYERILKRKKNSLCKYQNTY